MTNGVSRNRRRALSLSMPAASSDPISQLDRVVEALHQVNRALPTMALDRKELIAFGALLVQISGALLTFTDRLNTPAYHDAHTPPYPPNQRLRDRVLPAGAEGALHHRRTHPAPR